MKTLILLVAALALASCTSQPSHRSDDLAQPKRAVARIPGSGDSFLRDFAQTNRFRLGQPGSFSIAPDGSGVYFLRAAGPRDFKQDLWVWDVASKSEHVLLTADQLLGGAEEQLTPEEKARRERARSSSRGISSYELSESGGTVLVPLSGRLFVVDVASARAGHPSVTEIKSDVKGAAIDPKLSPDATMVACVRDGAVYVTRIKDGAERRVSPASTETVSYGEAEFVAQEEMDRSRGYWWSPSSDQIAFQRTDVKGVEQFTIADSSDPAKPAKTWPYPRAGKTNASVSLWVVRLDGVFGEDGVGEGMGPDRAPGSVEVQWDHAAFPYMAKVTWAKNAPLCVLVQNRSQTEQVLYRAETGSGSVMELLRERDDTWVNLHPSSPTWLEDGKSFLWMTEQPSTRVAQRFNPSDAWTLERHFLDKSPTRCVAPSTGVIRKILGVDQASGVVYAVGGARQHTTDVFALALGETSPDGSAESDSLGADPGVPAVRDAVVSPSGRLMVQWYTDAGGRLDWVVQRILPRHAESAVHRYVELESLGVVASVAAQPPFSVEHAVEFVTVQIGGASGQTRSQDSVNVAIVRPRDFNPSKKYPVLDFAYAGPHAKTVNASARGYLLHQWFADQGFIVVCIDGRGTPDKGAAWERAIKNNLIDAALDDHCAALEALCKKYPEMDRSRIGVNGWSFGGYFSATAVMRRPDVYKAGVAGAPVVDWRDYDTHYTERYLGMPAPATELVDGIPGNVAGYDASNVLTYAKDLSVPFLLIHGTADDNVYFVHSMKLCDALVRAKKPFEFMPLPGQTHGVTKPEWVEAVQSRIAGFFVRNLGAER